MRKTLILAAMLVAAPALADTVNGLRTVDEFEGIEAESERSVAYFDGRKVEGAGKKAKPVWRVRAHRKATTGLALAAGVPGLMATCSTDKTVKLWDISGAEPRELVAQNCGAGALFCCGFAPDSPCLLAAGGDTGEITFWDVRQHDQVQSAFGSTLAGPE